ncbi:hypothetical protein FACS1894207_3820 [Bacteroidia bacterium]|nr:hypothetical protein FACS1894207_3820 [Bacteroidia bacterium]
MDNIKVIVSNPTRMHTHQLCTVLEKSNRLRMFITSFWYKPNSFVHRFFCSLPIIGEIIKNTLKKRFYSGFSADRVITNPISEIFFTIKKYIPVSHKNDALKQHYIHDKFTARHLNNIEYDVFIGYEESCLRSFKTAKRQNKITILDLTQVHWKYLENVREKHPVYRTFQEDELFYKRSAIKNEELKYADYIFALSSLMKNSLIDNGIDKNKIFLINLGFDPSLFHIKNAYNLNEERPLKLLFVGGIGLAKGIELLLRMSKETDNVQLTFVGTIAENARNILNEYKEYYTHIPFLHHEELVKVYQEHDLFVFPSYQDSWAMVVLEAMACGTPVIITENTGSKDVVVQGGGKIIPVDDLDALKSAIDYYNVNRERLKEDGKKANEVVQNYTWDNYYAQINEVISLITK